MSEFIILCDSQYEKTLEDGLNPKTNILKWYCTDYIDVELQQVASEMLEKGYVRKDVKVVFLVGTHRRTQFVRKVLLRLGFLEEQLLKF